MHHRRYSNRAAARKCRKERHIEAEDEPRAHGRCGDDERHQRLGTQKAAQQAVNAIIVEYV